jgi:hypothetical protein
MKETKIQDIVWDPSVYPRTKWNTATIDRYADALEAGAIFPPIVIEEGTNRLLDGKHRLEAFKKAERKTIPAVVAAIPDGMTARYFAATLSATHGDRLSNADIKVMAEEEFGADPTLDPTKWGQGLGLSKSTVYRWVSHILEREKAGRATKAWRLSHLGWTQEEIGARLGVARSVVSEDVGNSQMGKIDTSLGPSWNEKGIAELANRMGLPLTDCYAAALDGMDDVQRLDALGITVQPYDVWHFQGCHDLMGDKYPGRIPGELVCHTLYFYTQPGDLVVDPMVGSGTTLDACLLMGRKARGYDIDQRQDRCDIETHDLSTGWPETVAKASLIFWDPPYFDKMDAGTIGEAGYIEGSISGMGPDEYMEWFMVRFQELHNAVPSGCRLAFLMSDWDSQNAKKYADHPGLFLWDYANSLQNAGWSLTRQIQCPLSTQQVHPDIVNKHRAARRLARLERYLLIGEKA